MADTKSSSSAALAATRAGDTSAPRDTARAKQVWLNGELVPAEQAKISVFDHGLLYGDGVFEGIRIYNGRILKLATHIARLFQSARHIDLNIPLTAEQIEEAARQTVRANGLIDGYLRLCVTRGAGTLGLNPYLCPKPSVFIIADTITLYAAEIYEKGMAVITAATIRNHPDSLSPRVKSLNYLNNILAKIEAAQANVPEAIMLNHLGYIAECTADNIFIVAKERDGRTFIATPPLHAGILEGVTRNAVIDLAEEAGYAVRQCDLTRHDLFTSDEVFITGTAAEVVPVTKIDGRWISDGKPGPVTRQLMAAYRKFVGDAPED